jgi:hypothetical protein
MRALAGFAKGTDISELTIKRQQSVAISCQMLECKYEAVDRTGFRLLHNRELGVGKSRRKQ